MNLYEREMRMMFADNDIIKNPLIVGRTLTGTLDEDLRIKLKFIASEVQGKYDTIRAVIINRTGGEVDSQNFLFADIIGMQQRNNGLPPIAPHMWENNNPKGAWYIPPTLEQKSQIGDTVLTYAEMFANQDMSMSPMNL